MRRFTWSSHRDWFRILHWFIDCGLKQVSQPWYAKMDPFLLLIGFSRCHSDPNVCILRQGDALLFLGLYVDNLIVTRSTSSIIACVKIDLHDRLAMTGLGLLHYFLGIEIN